MTSVRCFVHSIKTVLHVVSQSRTTFFSNFSKIFLCIYFRFVTVVHLVQTIIVPLIPCNMYKQHVHSVSFRGGGGGGEALGFPPPPPKIFRKFN